MNKTIKVKVNQVMSKNQYNNYHNQEQNKVHNNENDRQGKFESPVKIKEKYFCNQKKKQNDTHSIILKILNYHKIQIGKKPLKDENKYILDTLEK